MGSGCAPGRRGVPYRHEAAGRISVQISKPYNADQKSWGDRKTSTLGDLLSEIVAAFLRVALAGKPADEEQTAEKNEAERLAAERAR
jgi:hypothetical protein